METAQSPGAATPDPHSAATGPAPLGDGWRGRAVVLLDLDAFFASVEQLDHPDWRGKPVIVGGDADKRGVVSTASYEARAYGVHSAMPSAQARRLCPDAIWAPVRHERYRAVSRQVMACLEAVTPYVEPVSIDEAYFDVTPGRFSHEDPVGVCRRVAEQVAGLGVTCSMGLSTSKTVSKIASERNKPNGLTVVYPGTEAAFLAPFSVGVLGGVGPRTREALEKMGIKTLGQLAAADPEELAARLGVIGPRLAQRAAGIDPAPVAEACAPEEAKSVSSERTFARDLTDRSEVESAVRYVSGLTARRLRAKGLRGRTVTLKCARAFGETRTARTTLADRTDDELAIARAALGLLGQLWAEGSPVRLLGVGVSNWEERPVQLGLFDDEGEAGPAANETRELLNKTADRLRERFGASAAMYGSELVFKDGVSQTPSTHLSPDE